MSGNLMFGYGSSEGSSILGPFYVGGGGGNGATGATGATGPQGATGPIGGSTTQILYNNAGVAAGSASLTFASGTGTTTASSLVVTNNATISGNLLFPTVNVYTVSATSLTLTTASAGFYYYLSNSGFSNLTLPVTLPTAAGTFWTLRNATSSYLSATIVNNANLATPLILTPSNNTTIAVTVCGTNNATVSGYILF